MVTSADEKAVPDHIAAESSAGPRWELTSRASDGDSGSVVQMRTAAVASQRAGRERAGQRRVGGDVLVWLKSRRRSPTLVRIHHPPLNEAGL